jgi:archaellum component FlaD/FlaE
MTATSKPADKTADKSTDKGGKGETSKGASPTEAAHELYSQRADASVQADRDKAAETQEVPSVPEADAKETKDAKLEELDAERADSDNYEETVVEEDVPVYSMEDNPPPGLEYVTIVPEKDD